MPANPAPDPGSVPVGRIYLLLCGSLAAQALGQTAVFAVLPSIGREIGLLEIQVGAILAASSVVFFFAGPMWGRASDRMGRRKVFLAGQFGYVLGGSLFAAAVWAALAGFLVPLYAWFCMIVARMMQASLMSASQPAAGAYVADITAPSERAKGLARIGAANNMGSIIGPAIGGLLATISLLAPFLLAVVSVAVGALLSFLLLPVAPRHQSAVARPRVRFTDRRLIRWVVPGILMFLGAAVVQQTLSFRIQDALALSAADTAGAFGMTMVASAAAGLFAQTILVQRITLSPGGWLGLGLPLVAVALVAMAMFESLAAYVVANLIMGLGVGFAGAGFNAGASLSVRPEEQGGVSGITAACASAGWIVGPLVGPGLYGIAPELPFLFTAVLVGSAAIPILARMYRLRRLRRR